MEDITITSDTQYFPVPEGFFNAWKRQGGGDVDQISAIINTYGVTILIHTKQGHLFPAFTGIKEEAEHFLKRIYKTS